MRIQIPFSTLLFFIVQAVNGQTYQINAGNALVNSNSVSPFEANTDTINSGNVVTSVYGAEPGRVGGVPASYDPVSQTIRVVVNGGKIESWNMLGQKMDLDWRYDGTAMVANASSLKPGYYFIFGTASDGRLWSARVIVTK